MDIIKNSLSLEKDNKKTYFSQSGKLIISYLRSPFSPPNQRWFDAEKRSLETTVIYWPREDHLVLVLVSIDYIVLQNHGCAASSFTDTTHDLKISRQGQHDPRNQRKITSKV